MPSQRRTADAVLTRRAFVGLGAALPAAAATTACAAGRVAARARAEGQAACLVDTTLCIGCRKCEQACNAANDLLRPARPFSDRTVLRAARRPTESAFTVVNEFPGRPSPDQPARASTFVKTQCLHCLDPACVSACIVGAMTKGESGAVRYDPDICLGCRYCMVACPFGAPAFEYSDPVKPRVRKCEMCANTARGPRPNPACAAACPVEAIVFGERGALLELARARIAGRPDRYLPTIYGEHEVGGTSWLFLVGRPLAEIGLLPLPTTSPARVTEHIQHTIFRWGAIPIAAYGALGALMWLNHRRDGRAGEP
jgi:formate dehydrogenase iron-sulfur subunit